MDFGQRQTSCESSSFTLLWNSVFFKSVDPFDDFLPEAVHLAQEYLSQVSPEVSPPDSNIVLRYENLRIKNVGQGQISKLVLNLRISVPGLPTKTIRVERRLYLRNQEERFLTLFSFRGLPKYEAKVLSVQYSDYFGNYNHFHGVDEKKETLPYQIPPASKRKIFYENFHDEPFGTGWQVDYWRTENRGQLSDQIKIENRRMRFTGDVSDFGDRRNNHGVSYIDLNGRLRPGRSYEVQCRARSDPGTTARFRLWCHDIYGEGGISYKDRWTEERTPTTEWEDIKLVYTATQTKDLRIHLRYFPGKGTIYVDEVQVFEI